MSTVSSQPATTIDYVGDKKYKLFNPLDKDGDGVVDGKSLGGPDGKLVNESAINLILQARGLKAVNGEFQSVDGFNLSSTNASPVTNFGGPPTVPNVTGSTTPSSNLGGAFDWFDVTKGLEDAALMWMALSEMARTSMRDVKDAKELKHAMQKGKIEAKKNEIEATARRIEEERKEADRAFTWAVAGAVVSGGLGMAGGNNPVMAGLAGQAGNVVSALGNKMSHNGGPIARAKAQELREKNFQMQQEIMQQSVDEADSNYQEAKELMKLALKIMTEHVELQSQAVQTITRA